jgi:hypothetical protein
MTPSIKGGPLNRRAKTPRRRRQHVHREQLPLLEIITEAGEEQLVPMCGGCGRCAYTPLANSSRLWTGKPWEGFPGLEAKT